MLRSFLPARLPDVLLDPGSSQLRVALPGSAEVVSIPAMIAIRTRRSGRREVVAHGEAAAAMRGRTPPTLQLRRPVRGGRVLDAEALTALLQRTLGALGLKPRFARLRASVVWPDGPHAPVSPGGSRGSGTAAASPGPALEASFAEAGLRICSRHDPALAAALSCHHSAATHLVLVCGASTVHLRLLAQGAVRACSTIELGGDVLDAAILREVLRSHALHITPSAAELARSRLGPPQATAERCAPHANAVVLPLRGRCARTGLPAERLVPGEDLHRAMQPTFAAMGHALRRLLESLPPTDARQVAEQGVLLAGGLAHQAGLDAALRAQSGLLLLPTARAEVAPLLGAISSFTGPTTAAPRARYAVFAAP